MSYKPDKKMVLEASYFKTYRSFEARSVLLFSLVSRSEDTPVL